MFRNKNYQLRLRSRWYGLLLRIGPKPKPNSMTTLAKPAGSMSAIENGASKTVNFGTALAVIPYLLFILANVYDMNGTHGLKYISYLVLLLLIPCARRPLNLRVHEEFGIALLFFVWPACTLFIGLANGADLSGDFGAVSQVTPFLGFFVPLLVVPILGSQRVLLYMYYAFLTIGIVIVTCTALMYQGLAMGLITQIPEYVSAIYAPYHGGIGDYRLYFQATLWLVPAAIYFARASRFALAMLCLTALLMAGSRSGVITVVLFMLGISLSVKKYRVVGVISLVIGAAVGLFFLPGFIESLREAFLLTDSSGLLIRYGHASSAIQLFFDKPWTILIGNGAGATFYSNGTGGWEVRMETDHLDAIFHYGIIWFSAFSGLCAWTIFRLLRSALVHHKAHGLALLGMYIAAGTNPQLISPLFMFYLCACYLMARPLAKGPSAVPANRKREAGSRKISRPKLGSGRLNPA